MLLFNRIGFVMLIGSLDFNTSNVTIQPSPATNNKWSSPNFNTSNVTIQQKRF